MDSLAFRDSSLRIQGAEYMMARIFLIQGGAQVRRIATLVAVIVAVVFAAGVAQAAPPDKMSIDKIKKTKAAVAYNHKAHSEKVKECKTCHHKDAPGKEQACSSATCHGAKAEGKKLDLKEAFHKQCKDCHKKEKKGPQKCDECHPKK